MARFFLSIQEVPFRNKAMEKNKKQNLMKMEELRNNLSQGRLRVDLYL